MMRGVTYVGMNIGSISVKIVGLEPNGQICTDIINHQGRPLDIIEEALSRFVGQCYFGVSGHLGHITEPAAIERALENCSEEYDAVISLGGEGFAVYLLTGSQVQTVLSHNRCAAGSGEFLVQQVGRLNLDLATAIQLAMQGNSIKLASRCSVHCKSDVTHKLNRKEASLEDILWTIHENMAKKVASLLENARRAIENVLVIGGLTQNDAMLKALKQALPGVNVHLRPDSVWFEALGTALLTKDNPVHDKPELTIKPSFNTVPSLAGSSSLVQIIEKQPQKSNGIEHSVILGIDGGSTTTKAVLLDPDDFSVLASHYARTNGDPVNATKECLRSLISQVGGDQRVSLVSTTGSGREIIAAFVGTSGVYNEICAHATGASFYDPDVDTIFEIGGQDAKYVFLHNGVPIDYAMNSACSAGTGSFLEESAHGDLGVSVFEISDIALRCKDPVKFKADCAAFINSDIRTALQEGYSPEDIVGGLVVSIVSNYLTKVKGTRSVGKKVFFQGGVAKNQAVGYAFAQATGKQIIIPPDPELMGAFGVAIMAKQNHQLGLLVETDTSLADLVEPEMKRLGVFTCRSCTNYCQIERFEVAGRKFPFGGRCSKYESRWKNTASVEEAEDFVEARNHLVLSAADEQSQQSAEATVAMPTVGIPRAFSTHFLFPLYHSFFKELGYRVVLSDIDQAGEFKVNAPFCFPMHIAHGAVLDLVRKAIDLIFLPHVHRMPFANDETRSHICPIMQSSPYVMAKAFPEVRFLAPLLDFIEGYENAEGLICMATDDLGIDHAQAVAAYQTAVKSQMTVEVAMQALGNRALEQALSTGRPAVILTGRSYNAFPPEASQSLGRKMASKGVIVIPYDCLGSQRSTKTAWYFSNLILDAVEIAKRHPSLFILYVSNFSCSIDAFTHAFLRHQLGAKPYLMLEIDSHTADAGTQTRLEAFLEIIGNYNDAAFAPPASDLLPCGIVRENEDGYEDGSCMIRNSSGQIMPIMDSRVKVYFPPFSLYHDSATSMAFRWMGLHAPTPLDLDLEMVNRGLQYTSGRECIPLAACLGHMLKAHEEKKEGEIIGYYMIKGGAPCVIDSYIDFYLQFIEEHEPKDLFIFDPTASNAYYGLSLTGLFRNIPAAVSVADIMLEIHNALKVVGAEGSTDKLWGLWKEFVSNSKTKKDFDALIPELVENIKHIPCVKDIEDCASVVVTGDFFVRLQPFFYNGVDRLYAEKGILLKAVDLNELLLYSFYNSVSSSAEELNVMPATLKAIAYSCANYMKPMGKKYLSSLLGWKYIERSERKMRDKFKPTGLLFAPPTDVSSVYKHAAEHIHPSLYGETVLTIGKGVEAPSEGFDGIIVMGPFSCLPFRVSEAILKPHCLENNIPMLAFETDGSSISPTFLRQVEVHIQHVLKIHKQQNLPSNPLLSDECER